MLKLVLGVAFEVAVAMSIAGLLLAVVVPVVNGTHLVTVDDTASTIIVSGVLVAALAIALCRPGSAIRRYNKG